MNSESTPLQKINKKINTKTNKKDMEYTIHINK